MGSLYYPVHSVEIFYKSADEPDRDLLKLPIRGYVQAKSATTVEKMDRCSCVGVGKDPRRNFNSGRVLTNLLNLIKLLQNLMKLLPNHIMV